MVNPRAGRETRLVFSSVNKKKDIAVVGGGPAGLVCAVTAAERGHRVTLYEKERELGGQFNLAKVVPGKQEFAESVAYFAERLRRLQVKIELGRAPASAELAGFDEVVIATGIEPRRPEIPGIEHAKVASYVDVLAGRIAAGREVAVIGMGGIGFDVALYLLDERHATFESHWGITGAADVPGNLAPPQDGEVRRRITMLKRSSGPFGHTLGRTTGWVHRAELARHGVRMLKGVEYRRIDDAGLHIALDGATEVVRADTIVVCAGQVSRKDLKGTHVIGGAREAGELDAERAMREGAELGARL